MKITVLTLVFALFLVIASVINYSFFVPKNSVRFTLSGSNTIAEAATPGAVLAGKTDWDIQPWVWLLPLLAIPVLFIPLGTKGPEDGDDDDDFNYRSSEVTLSDPFQQATGVKGGKAEHGGL